MFWMRSIFVAVSVSYALAPAAAASLPAPLFGPVGLGGGLVEAAALMIGWTQDVPVSLWQCAHA